MILFHSILENYCKYLSDLNDKLFKFNYQKHISTSINFKKNKSILISKWNNYIYLSSKYLLKNNLNYQFVSRSFWDKFVNQYWQETLFISVNSIYSDYYINQLKSNGLLVNTGNQNKKFLLNFSKDLINGKVQVSLFKNNIDLYLVNKNNDKYIKYIWRKGVNWYIYNLYSKYLLIKNYLLRKKNTFISKYIEINTLPLFVITNQDNQIIISESSDRIFLHKYFVSLFKNFYDIFTSRKNHVGLLFINPRDALEYKHHSTYKYLSLNSNLLKLFVSQLSLYYKLLYSSIYNTEFRLIPDLEEISNIVYKYQYYNNISFKQSQKYGKDYFQGQPIYIIQPTLVKNVYTKKKFKLDYFYNISKNNNSLHRQAIFLNYRTALIAWKKFRQDYPFYKIPAQPNICVSNLEYFIKSQISQNSDINYIFIPSLETYNFIYSEKNLNSQQSIIKTLQTRVLYINNLCRRLVWSLVSKYPV
uniref:Ycf80 n=1 Tax=Caloglossa monosticha TaxID=76906 RepID=A0A1Z1M4P4_9FLOR|nr:hypothetical protein [Caloglossa monosticha]ARW61009.1 hypothetical protein [Caloglossa monosticha]